MNMKRIRQGNDFLVTWRIKRAGINEDLTQAVNMSLVASVKSDGLIHSKIVPFDIVDNSIVRIEVTPQIAQWEGIYNFVLKYEFDYPSYADNNEKVAVDKNMFIIVSRTAQADEITIIECESDVLIGLKGEKGDSAFTVWNKENGGNNTYDDWIDFLQAPATEIEGIVSANEAIRIENENTRKLNEIERKQSEETRLQNESARVTAEIDRESNEDTRSLNEATRLTNEDDRIANENQRVIDEEKREQLYDNTVILKGEVETLKTETETAKDSAISAATLANDKANLANAAAQNATNATIEAQTATQEATTAASLADTARLAIQDDLALKANHGYASNPKTLKEVEDTLNENSNMLMQSLGEEFIPGGYVYADNGSIISSGKRVYTDYINIEHAESIFVNTFTNGTTVASIAFYDKNKYFISPLIIDSGIMQTVNSSDFPANSVYIRCTGAGDGSEFCIIRPFKIQELEIQVQALYNSIHGAEFIFGTYIRNDTGVRVRSSTRTSTDFISIRDAHSIFVNGLLGASTAAAVAFYDIDKIFISAIFGENITTRTEITEFPANAEYIRCSGLNTGAEYCYVMPKSSFIEFIKDNTGEVLIDEVLDMITKTEIGNLEISSVIDENWEGWDDPAYNWGISKTSCPIPTVMKSTVQAEGAFVSRGGMGNNRAWRQHVFQGWNKENTWRFTIPVGINEENECALQMYKPDELKFGRVRVGTDAVNYGLLCEHDRTTVERKLLALRLPVYADNASAVSGGLEVNEIYRTATGELRIVV